MSNSTQSALILNDRFIQLAKKTNLQRLPCDNDYLYFHFITFPYFANIIESNKLGDLMYRYLIKVMNFRLVAPSNPIYKVNEMVTSMFILLEGTAVAYKPPKKYTKKKKEKGMSSFKMLFANILSSQIDKEVDYEINAGETYGIKELKTLKKRQCLVEAKTFCIIAEISKLDYVMIFEKTNFLDKLNVLNFLYHVKIFKACNNNIIVENLYDIMSKKKCKKGDVLFNQGDEFNSMYVVVKGTFKVIFYSNRKMINKFIHGAFDCKNNDEEFERFTNQRKYELLDQYEDIIEYKIVNYEQGELIGDLEYKYNKKRYIFSVICDLDDSEVLEFKARQFNKTITESFKNTFNEQLNWKVKYFKKRFDDIKEVNRTNPRYQNVFHKEIITKLTKNKKLNLDTDDSNYFVKVYNKNRPTSNAKRLYNTTNANIKLKLDKTDKSIKSVYNSQESENVQTNCLTLNSKRRVASAYPFKRKKEEFIPILKYMPKMTDENTTAPVTNHNTARKLILKGEIKKENKRILFTRNKNEFARCFEVNKGFFINNNTSILNKKLNGIFVNGTQYS